MCSHLTNENEQEMTFCLWGNGILGGYGFVICLASEGPTRKGKLGVAIVPVGSFGSWDFSKRTAGGGKIFN